MVGAALALAVAHAFLATALFVVARRLYTLVYPWRALATAAAMAVVTVAAATPIGLGLAGVAIKLGLLAAYAVALIVTGCVPWQEIRALTSPRSAVAMRPRTTIP
jgi:hypothetical protein